MQDWDNTVQACIWIPTIIDLLSVATETMLDQAEICLGDKVFDIAAGDGGPGSIRAPGLLV